MEDANLTFLEKDPEQALMGNKYWSTQQLENGIMQIIPCIIMTAVITTAL
jgi:hypothetical protein